MIIQSRKRPEDSLFQIQMMNDAKNALFMAGIDESKGGLYEGWNDLLSTITVSKRTVFYDSNIAFTDGTIGCSGINGSPKTVPNLYETLNGLNNRINEIHEYISEGIPSDGGITSDIITELTQQSISTADAYTYVSRDGNQTIIAPGNGSFGGKDEKRVMATNVFDNADCVLTLDAKNIRFTVDQQTYSLGDIFNMIKELDARTYALKTSITTRALTTADFTSDRFVLSDNRIDDQSPTNIDH